MGIIIPRSSRKPQTLSTGGTRVSQQALAKVNPHEKKKNIPETRNRDLSRNDTDGRRRPKNPTNTDADSDTESDTNPNADTNSNSDSDGLSFRDSLSQPKAYYLQRRHRYDDTCNDNQWGKFREQAAKRRLWVRSVNSHSLEPGQHHSCDSRGLRGRVVFNDCLDRQRTCFS